MAHSGNKYHRLIFPLEQYDEPHVDVYRVLQAFGVKNPGLQHSIKKLLCAGLRGKADTIQDLEEAIDAITEAIKIEKRENQEPILFAGKEALEGLEKRRQAVYNEEDKDEENNIIFNKESFVLTKDIHYKQGEKICINFEQGTITKL